jgi:hypothetical protein
LVVAALIKISGPSDLRELPIVVPAQHSIQQGAEVDWLLLE